MTKKSFIMYHDICEVFNDLTDEQAGQIIKEIVNYSKFKNNIISSEPSNLDGILKSVFSFFKTRMDKGLYNYGENHWNWKGGITSENHRQRNSAEYRQWRIGVFIRDSYICQECTQRGGTLHAHHIEHWSESIEKRFDVDNGITLCKECHIDTHSGEKTHG